MKKLFLFVAALALVGAGCTAAPEPSVEESPVIQGQSVQVEIGENGQVEVVENEPGDEEATQPAEEPQNVDEDNTIANQNPQNASDPAPSQQQPPAQEMAPESVVVTMVAKQWEFEPSVVRVKEGQRVDMQIISIDVDHGFRLPAFGIDVGLEPGKAERFSFVADKVGEHKFSCSIFCGQGHGSMDGTLIVE